MTSNVIEFRNKIDKVYPELAVAQHIIELDFINSDENICTVYRSPDLNVLLKTAPQSSPPPAVSKSVPRKVKKTIED